MTTRRGFVGDFLAGATALSATASQAVGAPLTSLGVVAGAVGAGVRTQQIALFDGGGIFEDAALHEWLRRFEPGLDDLTYKAIAQVGQGIVETKRHTADALLFEDHLAKAGQLLDQCLAYRTELHALWIAGFEACLEIGLGMQAVRQANVLAQATSRRVADEKLAEMYKAPATIEVNATQARVLGEISALAASQDKQRDAALLANGAAAQAALVRRRDTLQQPGGGNNYAERYQRLLRYFIDDLGEAYRSCYMASVAARTVYQGAEERNQLPSGLPLWTLSSNAKIVNDWADGQVPPLQGTIGTSSPDPLAGLVFWCRKTMTALERISVEEIDYSLSLPIAQVIRAATPGNSRTSILPKDLFEQGLDAAGNGEWKLNIQVEHLSDEMSARKLKVSNARIVGFGLRVYPVNTPGIPLFAPAFSATVIPPEIRLEDSVATRKEGSPFILGKVGLPPGNEDNMEYFTGSQVRNAPAVGEWTVRIHNLVPNLFPEIIPPLPGALKPPIRRDSANIKEAVLLLRLRGRVST